MTAKQVPDSAAVVDVLMTASKVVTAVVAHSMTVADPIITTTQLRLLVVLEAGGRMNLGALAGQLGVDPSTASRTCEQMVASKLVSRAQDPADRRQVALRLSRRGEDYVARLMSRRRKAFARIADQLSDEDARALAAGLAAFVVAADASLEPVVMAEAVRRSASAFTPPKRSPGGQSARHS